MKKILCPVDFSETSLVALEYAVKIGAIHQAELILLHVYSEEEYNQSLQTSSNYTIEEIQQQAESRMEKLRKEILLDDSGKKLSSCYYQFNVTNHEITRGIVDYLDEHPVDLIVMGTNGASKITESVVGSNTVKMIRKTEVPVLCIPSNAAYTSFQKVVYASDYEENDKIALQLLSDFMVPLNSELTVLHLCGNDRVYEQAIYSSMKEELKGFISDQLTVNYELRESTGDVEHSLHEYMQEKNADLLVLMTHQRNFFERIFHKSITKRLSYFTDYPLLIIKA